MLSKNDLILREVRQSNEYLELLMNLMLRAFPDIVNEQDRKAFEEAKKKHVPIGFKAPEENG